MRGYSATMYVVASGGGYVKHLGAGPETLLRLAAGLPGADKIAGIDPGSGATGIALGYVDGGTVILAAYGTLRPSAGARDHGAKALAMADGARDLLGAWGPACAGIETQYVSRGGARRNASKQSALKLAAVRGALQVEALRAGAQVVEVAPAAVKRAVGAGRASKEVVAKTVARRFGALSLTSDAADACAVMLAASAIRLRTRRLSYAAR